MTSTSSAPHASRDWRSLARQLIAGVGLPHIALAVQWALWGAIRPFAWFLFYPAVFASSWFGGLTSGLISTVLSAAIVWWNFIAPVHTIFKEDTRSLFALTVFLAMGVVFAVFNQRLRTANRHLEVANAQITDLYGRTKVLDDLKTEFFSSVSHELRTPLALILGPTEQLLTSPDMPEHAKRALEVVIRNARTLLRHVNDLLDVSKLEAGRAELRYAATDLPRLLRFVVGHFNVLASEKSIALVVEAPDRLVAQVDPDMLSRVLLNLLSNAFKFTPAGRTIRVSLRESEAASRVVFEVADSGPGIPAEQREVAFERFRQLEASPSRRFGGTGLGLAIARDFVSLHKGTISISDAPEGGALVIVDLPRLAPEGVHVAATSPDLEVIVGLEAAIPAAEGVRAVRDEHGNDAENAGKPLVLVVEDNAEMNEFIAESLSASYRVAAAFDGKEGLAKAIELRPDLVLSDVMMPVMSGDELVHALRQHPELSATPIMLLTARADDQMRLKLLRGGAQDYLTKPFSIEELLARVGNLVARKRAEDQSRELSEMLRDVAGASIAVSEAVAGLPGTSVDAVLRTVALQAQTLTGAEYVALGFGTDPEKSFDPWVYVGLNEAQVAAIGPHPRPVATLGVVARENKVVRLRDLRKHDAFRGFPANHPPMSSLLGVPIRYRGHSVGNLYLANKRGAAEFTERDQQIVEMLAARASSAIESARLYHGVGMERAWLQTSIAQMPEAVVLIDGHGLVTVKNRAAEAFASADGMRAEPVHIEKFFDLRRASAPEERISQADKPGVRAVRNGESTVGVEYLLKTRDGRLVPVILSAAPVRGPMREVVGATLIVQDIAVLKELERLREEWTSVIAHDLRQPVGIVMMSADSLLRFSGDTLSESGRKAVDRIRSAATRLARMVDDLLDASRIEAKRLSLDRKDTDLAALVHEIVDHMPDIASRCSMHETPSAHVPIPADPERIEQVLVNLLSNADKYGARGEKIVVDVERHPDDVEVTVTNRGPGIPPEDLPRLFSRYERGARGAGSKGIGLGLYISKGLVEAHGGRIWAESTLGETTSFHFTVPLESGAVEARV